jgi:hypothetical protein
MAINKNHEFDELDGVKCAIVEKNVSVGRTMFLKELLELNGYAVVTVVTPPPKAAPAVTATKGDVAPQPLTEPEPVTYTVGVTDVGFNAVNAIFGRLLRTKEGDVVTLAYWEQKEEKANDEVPYFQNPASFVQ